MSERVNDRPNERTSDAMQASRFNTWLSHHGYSIVASLGRHVAQAVGDLAHGRA